MEEKMKPSEKPYWNHYFTIQISKPRKWVRWDYVSTGNTARPLHIMPKRAWLGRKNGFWYEFKIPTKGWDNVIPMVCDEVESWGWRIYSDDSPQCNGDFRLVGGIDEALSQAKEYCKRSGLIPEGISIIGEDGSREEMPMDAEMMAFAEKCMLAVKSWRTGNGWPTGWRGNDC